MNVLTRRECDVVALIARGLTNRQIAGELVISERTVVGHVEHILAKLGMRSRVQVAAWAAVQGLARPE
ncbi:MAG: response regulator transcription factor [Chloroflexota bacterium]